MIQAVEHGFALLYALDLPPVALDTIDRAIAALDALDAPHEDLRPYLAGYCGDRWCDPRSEAEDVDSLDIYGEGDFHEDAEDDDPAEETSLETAGRGFVRCGADDAEENDASEIDDEPECDGGEPYLSVCEFDGRGDKWRRTGNPTTGWGTDVEDTNEDGSDDGREDHGWFGGEL